jgi:hypothetical protein
VSRRTPFRLLRDLALGVVLLITYGGYLLLDRLAAVSLNPRAVALFCGLALLALAPFLLGRRRATQIALPLGPLCAMLAVHFVDWDSRKPFLRALDRVEVGMTIAEVDATMAGFLRHPALPDSADGEAIISYRHTTEGWGDSDIGVIRFAGGRATSCEFLPD